MPRIHLRHVRRPHLCFLFADSLPGGVRWFTHAGYGRENGALPAGRDRTPPPGGPGPRACSHRARGWSDAPGLRLGCGFARTGSAFRIPPARWHRIRRHSAGGNRDGAEYLLRFLAENGYTAVAVQHPGSDTPAVFGGMPGTPGFDPAKAEAGARAAIAPGVAVDRFRDIPFAIDQLERMNAGDAKLRGRLDLTRVGMSGHSYGAITTMALSGQSLAGGFIATPSLRGMT